MISDGKKDKHRQLNTVDRLSDLPDFILHHIISFMDTKCACRTSTLSKRWTQITATNPVLEFYSYSKETIASYSDRIESTMQRYSKENLRITKLTLKYWNTDVESAHKVDEWLRIAICCRLTELDIVCPKIPEILFSAKSLTHLGISCAKIPIFQAIGLVSLKSLKLESVFVENRMLNHIISSCPLLNTLRLSNCRGFKRIVIPGWSELEELDLIDTLPLDASLILETSSLKCLMYMATNMQWPLISNTRFLRNLRKFVINHISFTDEDLGKLLSELPLVEDLIFVYCTMPSTIRISNTQLKNFYLYECYDILDVKIDAPNLKTFEYDGPDFVPALSIISQANCEITLKTQPKNFDTQGFLKLKKLLMGLRSCEVLAIRFCSPSQFDEEEADSVDLKFDEEEVESVDLGPSCEIRKLKLNLMSCILTESSLSAFLDGLFWTCHPDTIYLQVSFDIPNVTIAPLIRKLKHMANSWRHPLKGIEVEGSNCEDLLMSQMHDINFRLNW